MSNDMTPADALAAVRALVDAAEADTFGGQCRWCVKSADIVDGAQVIAHRGDCALPRARAALAVLERLREAAWEECREAGAKEFDAMADRYAQDATNAKDRDVNALLAAYARTARGNAARIRALAAPKGGSDG